MAPDLSRKQFHALVAFVDTLPRPVEILPENPDQQNQALRGKVVFSEVGCAICHTPDLGGVKGVYSDFLLYRMDTTKPGEGAYGPEPPLPAPSDEPAPEEWKTPPLWGVADSAPYLHDGRAATLMDAIFRHGGDALPITNAFRHLPAGDQEALLAFLKTLKAPPEALPVEKLAKKN